MVSVCRDPCEKHVRIHFRQARMCLGYDCGRFFSWRERSRRGLSTYRILQHRVVFDRFIDPMLQDPNSHELREDGWETKIFNTS